MFIGGMSPSTSESSMKLYFELFGEVSDPIIMRDKDTHTSRGFGFVTFKDSPVLDEVLQMTPHIIDGKQVECKRAVPKD